MFALPYKYIGHKKVLTKSKCRLIHHSIRLPKISRFFNLTIKSKFLLNTLRSSRPVGELDLFITKFEENFNLKSFRCDQILT